MILSVCPYEVNLRKGMLLFHQKCENANSKVLAHRIFDTFALNYSDILKDKESTRIPVADDMNDPEIQLLEHAKIKTLRSLPQSSLYWGSDLFMLHINSENVFVKLPLWFEVHRIRGAECETVEIGKSWTKLIRNPSESFLISPRTPYPTQKKLLGARAISKRISFKLASFLSSPLLNLAPSLCIDTVLLGDS